MRTKLGSRRLGLVLLMATLLACSQEDGGENPAATRGRKIYMNVCIQCHAGDPTKDGAVGPALAGSSLELLEARVLRGEYPPGYTPKRSSGAMPQFPYLEDQIGDLAAYLAQAAED